MPTRLIYQADLVTSTIVAALFLCAIQFATTNFALSSGLGIFLSGAILLLSLSAQLTRSTTDATNLSSAHELLPAVSPATLASGGGQSPVSQSARTQHPVDTLLHTRRSNQHESIETTPADLEPDRVTQSWTRVATLSGEERIEGMLRISFQAYQRRMHLHLPIHPAFPSQPQAWVECDDLDISCTVEECYPYGVRLAVQRGGVVSFAAETELQFVIASTVQSQSEAA